MNRREFLKQVARWSAGGMVAAPVFTIAPGLLADDTVKSKIVVGSDPDVDGLITSVVSAMGGMAGFVNKGDHVVIKPNIGWDRRPEQAANTHPMVVKALVEHVLEAGAKKVSIFDRTCNEERRCYYNSGIKPVVDKIDDRRVSCNYIDDRKFIPVNIKKGKNLNQWPIYREVLEADCYINVPVAKHHSLAKLTLGLKNVMGVIGDSRGKIHFNLAQNLADLNTVVRPTLTVVDATRILLRNGPQGGDLNDVKTLNTVVASTDPVAADAYAATLFGLSPDAVPSTVAAYKMGLGEMDLAKCIIKKI
ncbi:MAG: DUF362 domain-containing protein [Thermodesulfobacteriota bacterium]|nr:DUF362 domain-containing protein [Thermodesulfobacteriota bacterium]